MERTWCKRAPAAEMLIKGGRLVDPEARLDGEMDVLVTKGKVRKAHHAKLQVVATLWPSSTSQNGRFRLLMQSSQSRSLSVMVGSAPVAVSP